MQYFADLIKFYATKISPYKVIALNSYYDWASKNQWDWDIKLDLVFKFVIITTDSITPSSKIYPLMHKITVNHSNITELVGNYSM